MSEKHLQENWKFSGNFIKIFQQCYQLITKYLDNFLQMFVKLTP